MSENVRVLFRELAGLGPFDRENCYARQHVPTVVRDELWKIGQLRPGDRVRFRRIPQPAPRADNPSVLLELPASPKHAAFLPSLRLLRTRGSSTTSKTSHCSINWT